MSRDSADGKITTKIWVILFYRGGKVRFGNLEVKDVPDDRMDHAILKRLTKAQVQDMVKLVWTRNANFLGWDATAAKLEEIRDFDSFIVAPERKTPSPVSGTGSAGSAGSTGSAPPLLTFTATPPAGTFTPTATRSAAATTATVPPGTIPIGPNTTLTILSQPPVVPNPAPTVPPVASIGTPPTVTNPVIVPNTAPLGASMSAGSTPLSTNGAMLIPTAPLSKPGGKQPTKSTSSPGLMNQFMGWFGGQNGDATIAVTPNGHMIRPGGSPPPQKPPTPVVPKMIPNGGKA